MTIEAELHNGTVLEFPDGTSDQVIKRAVQGQLGVIPPSAQAGFESAARETGPAEAGLVAAGRGLTTIGRALGLAAPESEGERAAFEALQEQQPVATTVGEIAGETAPFLAPGAGLGAIPALATRAVAATGLGAVEGGLIARGRGDEALPAAGVGGVVAGGIELAFPVIGRLGGALVRRVTGQAPKGALLDAAGNPTPELTEALNRSGFSFDDLTQEAQDLLAKQAPGASPEEAARLASFEALGAPATKGDISQDFAQQALEGRLVESAADPLGDPLRALRLEQSRAFSQKLDQAVEQLGVPAEVGDSLKDALEGRSTLLRAQKNALYKQVAESSPNVQNAPILTDAIVEALPDKDILEDLEIVGANIPALRKALVRFGIEKDAGQVDEFVKAGGTITPLNVGNFDRFRKLLGGLERADQTGSASVAIGPIRNALDGEADLVGKALEDAGISDVNIIGPLKEARSIVRQRKTEFSPQAISGRLIGAKRDGVTPIIESSKVFNEVLGTNKAPELLDRTLESLRKSGDKGVKAIGDLQARTIMELMDSAFGAQTRKIQGERVFGSGAFNKKLEQIGEQRLNSLFKNKPDALKKLRQVSKAAESLTPPSGAIPKGSASVILDSLNKLGLISLTAKIPGGGLFVETIKTISEKGANRKTLENALNAKPKVKQMAGFIERDLPGLASALGIAGISTEQQERQ